MEKYIGTYHKSSPFIQNVLKKQICSFEILWQNYPPPTFGDFFPNLPICRFTEICMQKSPPPQFGDFFSNLTLCRFAEICMQKFPPSKELWVIQP